MTVIRTTMSRYLTFIMGVTALSAGGGAFAAEQPSHSSLSQKPNVVIFYVDDLGYGDISPNGAIGVSTPNLDALASKGVSFTDAHSTASTCTPSRYSLLTGEHGFRQNAAILPGDAPALIRPGKATLPSMLQKAGYTTGVIGKWHLGLGDGSVDWNQDVKPGPLEIGFNYSFLLPATGDRVPTVYLEDHKVVNLERSDPIEVSYDHKVGDRPTGVEHPELLRMKADLQHSETIVNGISRIGSMSGGESALWVDEEFPDVFSEKAVDFIEKSKKDPFFLFFSFQDIHVPRLPNERFKGKSTMGPRGDAIAQMDWVVGRVMQELKIQGVADNTLVIFTSDNGPVLDDGYDDMAVEMLGEHTPAGPFRGGKYSVFEGGTRVPMIVYWPNKSAHTRSNALISQVDIYASLAGLVNQPLAKKEAIDSLDVMKALLGQTSSARTYLLEESAGTVALRKNNWKYIKAISKEKGLPNWLGNKDIEMGFELTPQLFDLTDDISEQTNRAKEYPVLVNAMEEKIQQLIEKGFRYSQ